MKTLLIALLCLPAFAATTVTDTVKTFDGSNFTGSIVINAPRMTTVAGATIAPWSKTYAVTNGAFSASFVPNDTSTPAGTSYAVQYRPNQGSAYSEYWIVVTSGSPVTISQIAVFNAVTPSLTLNLSQLSGVGVAKGSILGFGTAWGALAPGTDTYVLTADSTQPRGIKWGASSGGGGTFPVTTHLIAGDGAGNGVDSGIIGVSPFSSGYQSVEYCKNQTFDVVASFGSITHASGQVLIDTLPAYFSVSRVVISEAVTVTSGAGTVTQVAASVGTTTAPDAYTSGSFPLMGASSPTFREFVGSGTQAATYAGTQAIYLQLAVYNANPGNLTNLTAGSVEVAFCGVIRKP